MICYREKEIYIHIHESPAGTNPAAQLVCLLRVQAAPWKGRCEPACSSEVPMWAAHADRLLAHHTLNLSSLNKPTTLWGFPIQYCSQRLFQKTLKCFWLSYVAICNFAPRAAWGSINSSRRGQVHRGLAEGKHGRLARPCTRCWAVLLKAECRQPWTWLLSSGCIICPVKKHKILLLLSPPWGEGSLFWQSHTTKAGFSGGSTKEEGLSLACSSTSAQLPAPHQCWNWAPRLQQGWVRASKETPEPLPPLQWGLCACCTPDRLQPLIYQQPKPKSSLWDSSKRFWANPWQQHLKSQVAIWLKWWMSAPIPSMLWATRAGRAAATVTTALISKARGLWGTGKIIKSKPAFLSLRTDLPGTKPCCSTCPTLLAPRVVVGGGRRCLQSCWHGECTGPAAGAARRHQTAGEACGWHSCIDSALQLLPSLVVRRSFSFQKTKQAKWSCSSSSFSHPLGLISMGIQKQGWVTCMLTLHGAQLLPEIPVPPAAHREGLGHSLGTAAPSMTHSAPGSATRSHCKWLTNANALPKQRATPARWQGAELACSKSLPNSPSFQAPTQPQHCTTTCLMLFPIPTLPVSSDSNCSRSAKRCQNLRNSSAEHRCLDQSTYWKGVVIEYKTRWRRRNMIQHLLPGEHRSARILLKVV